MRKTDIFPALFGILCGLLVYVALFGQIDTPVDARTVITVGSEPLTGFALQNITTNGSGYATVDVDTLKSPVSLGNGLSLRNYSGVLQTSTDGNSWQALSSTGRPVLSSSTHTTMIASGTISWYSELENDFQLSAHFYRQGIGTAEDILSFYSSAYGCHVWRFGLNSSNRLFVTYLVDISGTPGSYTCTTATVTSTLIVGSGFWAEAAVQHVDTSNTFYFYLNGEMFSSVSGVSPIYDLSQFAIEPVQLRLFEGFAGKVAAVKFGNSLTWPTTGSRMIDLSGVILPGGLRAFAFSEGAGTTTDDLLNPTDTFTLGSGVTWTTVPPIFF